MKISRFSMLVLLFAFSVSPLFKASAYEIPEGLYQYLATVGRVVDGNTISVDVDLGFGVWMHKTEMRLVGVKTPSMKGETMKQGVAAAKFLQETLKDRERILVKTSYDPTGKYDGWLAIVFIWDDDEEDWVSVNQMIIDAGHGEAE